MTLAHAYYVFTIVSSFVHFPAHCFSLYPSHISSRIYLARSPTSGSSTASQSVISHSSISSESGFIALRKQFETSDRLRHYLTVMPIAINSAWNEGDYPFGEVSSSVHISTCNHTSFSPKAVYQTWEYCCQDYSATWTAEVCLSARALRFSLHH